MTADETKSSSIVTALEGLKATSTPSVKEINKESEKKEAAAEAMRTRCKVCFKETSPQRICGGHGGGGGSSSDSTSEEKETQGDGNSLANKPGQTVDAADGRSMRESENIDSNTPSNEAAFNPEIIAELIANKLLVIDNDRKSMTLTLQLKCDPHSLSKEQRHELKKFMEAILKELNAFKEENNISTNCVNLIRDKDGNILSLRIILPTLALYDAFIQRLANNLLPTPRPELQAQDGVKKNQRVVPNPLSMEPKPSKPDEEEQKIFNPTPFSMRPKGW